MMSFFVVLVFLAVVYGSSSHRTNHCSSFNDQKTLVELLKYTNELSGILLCQIETRMQNCSEPGTSYNSDTSAATTRATPNPISPTTVTTTTPTTTTTTTTISTTPDICKARRTGVDINGIGKLIVGPEKLTFNQSVAYCANNMTGCNLWIPKADNSVITPLIFNITLDCDEAINGAAFYWFGLTFDPTSNTVSDITGAPWNLAYNEMIAGDVWGVTYVILTPSDGHFNANEFTEVFYPICHCSI